VIEIRVRTTQRVQCLDVTDRIQAAIERSGAKDGVCLLFCPHTTAGLTLNETADPAVAQDMADAFGELVREGHDWRHLEGNSPAHVQASLAGSHLVVGLEAGGLDLGRWQGILLCEFDGPRDRTVKVRILA
jgi:secondary thiamine-phosphate synthase enzyme